MIFFRVTGVLWACFWSGDAIDDIDLDLVVPARGVVEARLKARQIAAQGYDYSDWRGDPIVEAACSQNEERRS